MPWPGLVCLNVAVLVSPHCLEESGSENRDVSSVAEHLGPSGFKQ